ncbi:hypothetical protein [Pseudomonas fluorescens]|uniref:hypothetical protein n=1 Tax=Pseudomonas TaxID=286 RepID=UPI003CFBC6B9
MTSLTKTPFLLMLLIGLSLTLSPAHGIDLDIKAEFSPDPAKPMKNEFTNTTEQSGYCLVYPQHCVSPPMVSFRLPIQFRSRVPVEADHAQRQGAMFNLPSHWQTLTVTDPQSGQTQEVQVRVSGIGTTYVLSEDVRKLVGVDPESNVLAAHELLWVGGRWSNGAAPCRALSFSGGGVTIFGSFWQVPLNAGVCAKQAKFLIPELRYRDFDIGYQLIAPRPLEMASGVYVGSIQFPIGPDGIDLGDNMYPVSGDSVINLRFTLTVTHTLKVDVPPGGNRVELVPQGGWNAWLQQGRKPTRLFRDQTFTISASSRFKMQLECQYSPDGKTCGVRDADSGHAVPLNVSVSLPHGLSDVGGLPVNHRQLLRDGSGTELFQPGFYVDRKPGTLHFEIPSSDVAEMIRPGSQRQYSGSVTVIWDSDV